MNNLQWQFSSFSQLSNQQLYDVLKLRVNVFIVEQNCPYPELDDNDTNQKTIHLLAHENKSLIAYARLLPPGLQYPETSIGRIVVIESARRRGIGLELVEKSIIELNQQWPEVNIKISAQEYLQKFYERLGFIKISEPYLEDNIPHIEMLKAYHAT